MTPPRPLKVGDRVRVTDPKMRHYAHEGTVVMVAPRGGCWVSFSGCHDGKCSRVPLLREELRPLPRRKKR